MKSNIGQMYGIGILSFILFLSTLIGTPVLPALSEELGASSAQIPIVLSAALATVVVAQLFTGFLADRYSKRTLILTGALVGAVSSILCAVATQWGQLVILRVVSGVADALAMPTLLAVTATLGKDQPGRFFGILRGSQGLSFAIGPTLGSIFSLISLRAPFIADGLFSLVAFSTAVVIFKETDKPSSEHDIRLFRGMKSVFSVKKIFIYLLLGISALFGWGILSSFVPTKAQLTGLDAWQIGLVLAGGAAIYSFTSYIIGTLSDRFGRKLFAVTSQVVMLGAALGLTLSNNFPALFAFYGLFCAGEAIAYLLCFVYASESFEKKYVATSMGVFDSVIDLSLFLGPFFAIFLYGSIGQIEPIFIFAVAPAAVTFFAAFWLSSGAK